jgi:AcrR family transcriptional regulator
MQPKTRPAKDTPKSLKTRARILARATELFASVGYHEAGNAVIAEAAGLTRGAMLYHFPTREALVEGVVEHIARETARLFEAAARERPLGSDVTEHAIEAYWRLLHETPFVALRELQAVARTDSTVAVRIADALEAFDRTQFGEPLTALFNAGDAPRLQTGRDLARFVLEGMAQGGMTYDDEARAANLLGVVKRAVRMLNRKGDVGDLWPD